MGLLVLGAISERDYPLLQALIILFGAIFLAWMAIFPGLAISLAIFGFNLLGDALRDLLDPRLRSERR